MSFIYFPPLSLVFSLCGMLNGIVSEPSYSQIFLSRNLILAWYPILIWNWSFPSRWITKSDAISIFLFQHCITKLKTNSVNAVYEQNDAMVLNWRRCFVAKWRTDMNIKCYLHGWCHSLNVRHRIFVAMVKIKCWTMRDSLRFPSAETFLFVVCLHSNSVWPICF